MFTISLRRDVEPCTAIRGYVEVGAEVVDGAAGGIDRFSSGPRNLVASRLTMATALAVLSRRAAPWCPVIDVQITGDDGIGNPVRHRAAQLGEILQRPVPQRCAQSRVFNLFLGIATPIQDGKYSSLAKLLDYLSRASKSSSSFPPAMWSFHRRCRQGRRGYGFSYSRGVSGERGVTTNDP